MTRTAAEYNRFTCVQLRGMCKERGLIQKGVKAEVIERLMQNDDAAAAAADASATTPAPAPASAQPQPVVEKQEEEEEDIGIILGSPTKVLSTATTAKSPAAEEDSYQDEAKTCKLFEGRSKYLSPSGLHFIANHQYRGGEYTHLDNLLNPFWTYLTELLPLWLAPNMVTTLGGLHCALAYGTLWYYCPDFNTTPPDWVVMLAAYCTFAYYTLDCMDGKQARRTGSSSPLGQLL